MKASWIFPDGTTREADIREGLSLMEAAVANGVPGVIGECGGTLSCATCHVIVSEAWREATGEPGDFEDAMLDAAEAPRETGSRLSCQLVMSEALDGIVLRIPGA